MNKFIKLAIVSTIVATSAVAQADDFDFDFTWTPVKRMGNSFTSYVTPSKQTTTSGKNAFSGLFLRVNQNGYSMDVGFTNELQCEEGSKISLMYKIDQQPQAWLTGTCYKYTDTEGYYVDMDLTKAAMNKLKSGDTIKLATIVENTGNKYVVSYPLTGFTATAAAAKKALDEYYSI